MADMRRRREQGIRQRGVPSERKRTDSITPARGQRGRLSASASARLGLSADAVVSGHCLAVKCATCLFFFGKA